METGARDVARRMRRERAAICAQHEDAQRALHQNCVVTSSRRTTIVSFDNVIRKCKYRIFIASIIFEMYICISLYKS